MELRRHGCGVEPFYQQSEALPLPASEVRGEPVCVVPPRRLPDGRGLRHVDHHLAAQYAVDRRGERRYAPGFVQIAGCACPQRAQYPVVVRVSAQHEDLRPAAGREHLRDGIDAVVIGEMTVDEAYIWLLLANRLDGFRGRAGHFYPEPTLHQHRG